MSWETLAITALQTKVTTGRLLLIRIEDHKEHIWCLSRCAWLVWVFRVFSMVQHVPTAGRCPRILFWIVTRSLACFCRALGCLVRRLTTLAISAFICPCPKLQYAWDSFWQFPHATHCTACTPNHWSCNPHQAAPQMGMQQSMMKNGRNHEDLLAPWVAFNPEAMHQPHCTLSMFQSFQSLSMLLTPFSSNTILGKETSDQWQEKALASSFTAYLHELSRWPQHYYENDSNILIFPDSGLCNDLETVGKGHPFSNAVIQCAFPASKHLKSLELLKHAQLASHCAG